MGFVCGACCLSRANYGLESFLSGVMQGTQDMICIYIYFYIFIFMYVFKNIYIYIFHEYESQYASLSQQQSPLFMKYACWCIPT